MADPFQFSRAEEVFHLAVRELTGRDSQRERLSNAFLYHVATLQDKELPPALRAKFVQFKTDMHNSELAAMDDEEISALVGRLLERDALVLEVTRPSPE
ncbi:MAG: hypothetical protein ACREU2_03025 [Steroidobacteraceae bacterium]